MGDERMRKDPAFQEAVYELLVRVAEMGETGLFMVLTYDPQTKQHLAHGDPVDGPQAAIQADERRQSLNRSQLEDVQVMIVPWQAE
jgi:hypothetical protein